MARSSVGFIRTAGCSLQHRCLWIGIPGPVPRRTNVISFVMMGVGKVQAGVLCIGRAPRRSWP